MAGPVALVGSGEFLPDTESIDRALLQLGDDPPPRVAILPTAAGQEGPASIDRWLELGTAHYERLGAIPVPLPVVDNASANDPDLADEVASADLVYFSGGDPPTSAPPCATPWSGPPLSRPGAAAPRSPAARPGR